MLEIQSIFGCLASSDRQAVMLRTKPARRYFPAHPWQQHHFAIVCFQAEFFSVQVFGLDVRCRIGIAYQADDQLLLLLLWLLLLWFLLQLRARLEQHQRRP